MNSVRIVLADDHPLMLQGTKQFLEGLSCVIVATAKDGNEAYNLILKHKPEIAVLDFDLPKLNGIEIAKYLNQKNIETKIIVLTLHKQEAILKEVGATIAGYLTKDSALDELESCIKIVVSGDKYISSKLKQTVHFDTTKRNVNQLTVTELKILKYIEQRYTSAQIAEALFISKRTVEKHRSNIIEKLSLPSTPNALVLWLKQNPDYAT
ncbi:MAG: response regulator transcription factor [Leeuwenhoekiella sp.]|jgi:DNA-binding NarL/FixJ family response regulator|uniref:response regulator n=1 Tax=Leeuwenhoekiella TaxID=283735 RepID=UPI000C4BDF99|nr:MULTISPECIES: response regulator transcription factor [Leeuwenhoekiella]MAO44755.1 DNA-binding response regulator [Leeuwenhoekiella sp.]MBQ52790.1 DNA-binding response regulator [Leeuwenhoekiella sp.]HBT08818.1 DNA-binding response regulator [Leeuwenhoekiella sp.]HCW65207.1 DNA-binding response regulator [Leeuwenhoekiella sp.]|tara:strand:- start:2382 stop:3008 length:627 start_codon:yes stop_codon:yes gene_type:complete